MRPDEIVKKVNENSKFVKLSETDPVIGHFEGDFKEVKKTYDDGATGISYEGVFVLKSGVTKTFSCSGALIQELTTRCKLRGIDFYDAEFSILKKGTGRATRYIVEIVGNVGPF